MLVQAVNVLLTHLLLGDLALQVGNGLFRVHLHGDRGVVLALGKDVSSRWKLRSHTPRLEQPHDLPARGVCLDELGDFLSEVCSRPQEDALRV